jgi:hypothetical protein
MLPRNIAECRGRRPRRSVLTLERRLNKDVMRQLRRHQAGRYVYLAPHIKQILQQTKGDSK